MTLVTDMMADNAKFDRETAKLLRSIERQDASNRYCNTLRSCQKCGTRIGIILHNGWPCAAYVLDGVQYRFRRGRIIGQWRQSDGERISA